MTTPPLDIEGLSFANIDSEPVNYDWSARWDGEGEPAWKFYEVTERDEPLPTDDEDDETEEEFIIRTYHCSWEDGGPNEGIEGPMMNYHYPFDAPYGFDPRESAVKLVHTPVCIIEWNDGGYSLALTGGGMDLSWEICEAFILLGSYPPMHFVDLPTMAGKERDPNAPAILQACVKTVECARERAERARDRLGELASRLGFTF